MIKPVCIGWPSENKYADKSLGNRPPRPPLSASTVSGSKPVIDDERIWAFEESLWTASPDHYAESIDDQCLMVLPAEPFVFNGEQSIAAVSGTPRWEQVELTERQVARPQEGLIVIAYRAEARQGERHYVAYCTSTYRHLPGAEGERTEDRWQVVQHQQTVPPGAA